MNKEYKALVLSARLAESVLMDWDKEEQVRLAKEVACECHKIFNENKMKKTFVIQVEYPDCDFVPSEEVMEVTQECIEQYMERYFGANIMDGDYDRIKVKEVTDGFSLVKRMREAQKEYKRYAGVVVSGRWFRNNDEKRRYVELIHEKASLESEVDEYLKKMEI